MFEHLADSASMLTTFIGTMLATSAVDPIVLPDPPAWVPLKYPMTFFHTFWYLLLIPMAFGISLTYKAMRMPQENRIWSQALLMTAQVVGGMIALAVALTIFVQFVIPAV